jgi:hypothetical protein
VATEEFEFVRDGVVGRLKEGRGLGDGKMLLPEACLRREGITGAVGVCRGVTSVVPEVLMPAGKEERLGIGPV